MILVEESVWPSGVCGMYECVSVCKEEAFFFKGASVYRKIKVRGKEPLRSVLKDGIGFGWVDCVCVWAHEEMDTHTQKIRKKDTTF